MCNKKVTEHSTWRCRSPSARWPTTSARSSPHDRRAAWKTCRSTKRRDVDLAAGRLVVGRSKTHAGVREVDMLPALRDELTSQRHASALAGHDAFLFPTAAGTLRDKDNARHHVINPVIRATEQLLRERGETPLPDGLTAHKLRHTFTSLLFALGRDPAYVMGQLDNTSGAA